MHFYNNRTLFPNKKRIFITHNSAHLHFAPKWITIHGTISHGILPYSMEAKKRESKRPLRRSSESFLRSGCLRDAFGTQAKVCLHV